MEYKIRNNFVEFGPGYVLGLSPSQAEGRLNRIEPIKGTSHFLVNGNVQFKIGETVAVVEGAVTKAMLVNLEPSGQVAAAQ